MIVGTKPDQWVIEQVDIRERKFANPATVEDIQTQNATSWLRLASGVNITDAVTDEVPGDRVKEWNDRVKLLTSYFGVDKGDDLARHLVLAGGTLYYDNKNNFTAKSGVNLGSQNFSNSTYGFLTGEFENRPMPGIQSIETAYYNKGALEKATIKIRVNNPKQLDALEILYLRPGMTVLAEWGHSDYYSNPGNVKNVDFITKPIQQFFSDTKDVNSIYDAIQAEKLSRSGNYHAFYGVVTNFNYTIQADASFEVSLDVITIGAIIEALGAGNHGNAANVAADTAAPKTGEDQNSSEYRLRVLASKSPIVERIYRVVQAFAGGTGWEESNWIPGLSGNNVNQNAGYINQRAAAKILGSNVVNLQQKLKGENVYFTQNDTPDALPVGNIVAFKLNSTAFQSSTSPDKAVDAQLYYMTFGALLSILESDHSLFVYDNPVFEIENPLSTKRKYPSGRKYGSVPLISFLGHMSADPRVCAIQNNEFILANGDENSLCLETAPVLGCSGLRSRREYPDQIYASQDLMKVQINVAEILEAYEASKNKRGKPILITFLQRILDDVSEALGGINDIKVGVSNEDHIVYFYDQGTHALDSGTNDLLTFKSYGRTPSRTTILKEVNWTTQITNEFAAMIAIGAQAYGNQVSENSTAFSEFNFGLMDRHYQVKNVINQKTNVEVRAAEWQEIIQLFDNYKAYASAIWGLDPTNDVRQSKPLITDSAISSLRDINYRYAHYVLGYIVGVQQGLPTPFFLPFDLKLKLDGLSGLKLLERINITEELLPLAYKGKVNFLIKEIKHIVNENKWNTEIVALTIPALAKADRKNTALTACVIATTQTANNAQVDEYNSEAQAVAGTATTTVQTSAGPNQPVGGNIYYKTVTAKKQIVLHHTAAPKNAKWQDTLRWWNTHGQNTSTHFIVDRDGSWVQVLPLNYYANHASPNKISSGPSGPNGFGIGIEIQNAGWLRPNGKGQYVSNAGVPGVWNENEVTPFIDKNGKKVTYRNESIAEKVTDAQIKAIETIIRLIGNSPEGKNIPWTWDYDKMFPKQTLTASEAGPGIYSHCSYNPEKIDITPQKPIIDMLNRLSEEYKSKSVNRPLYDAILALDKQLTATLTTVPGLKDPEVIAAKNAAIEQMKALWDKIDASGSNALRRTDNLYIKANFGTDYLAWAAWLFGSKQAVSKEGVADSSHQPYHYYKSPNFRDSYLESAWQDVLDKILVNYNLESSL